MLVVLIDKVLREGVPITRIVLDRRRSRSRSRRSAQLPPGAVPAFLGLLLIVAVLIEPWLIRRKRLPARLWAWLRGLPPPPALEIGGVAIEGAQTKGAMASDKALSATGFGKFLARRDARRSCSPSSSGWSASTCGRTIWGNLAQQLQPILSPTPRWR